MDSFGNNVWRPTAKVFEELLPRAGFRFREGQFEMTMDILDTLGGSNQIRVIEAGVGIGKSYAYLVPTILAKNAYPYSSIIVSTGTISLQEQLVQDVRKLLYALSINSRISVILSKGQTHFLCKKNAQKKYAGQKPKWLHKVDALSDFGDRSEIEKAVGYRINEWDSIRVDATCTRRKCPLYWDCGYMRLRQEMRKIDNIIVTNHDQLIQDGKLPDRPLFHTEQGRRRRDIIVIDEAHTLEEKARSAERINYSNKEAKRLVSRANSLMKRSEIYGDVEKLTDQIERWLDNVYYKVYEQCQQQLVDGHLKGEYPDRFYIKSENLPLVQLARGLRELNQKLQLHVDIDESDEIIESLTELEYFFLDLDESADRESEFIYWAEMINGTERGVTLNRVPKDIARSVRERLFEAPNTKIILTSATITNPGDTLEERYKYFLESNGVPLSKTDLSEPQPSPFDYTKNSILYIPSGLPSPRDREQLCIEGAKEIEKLIRLTEGRAMVLFTAKQDMNVVYELLKDKDLPWKLLIQSNSGSQNEVRNEFIRDEHSILFSTGSFWEGIDVPGPSLSNLIIFKLPFPVPDPIYDYKISQAETRMQVLLPEMLMKLRQGLGRLIRKENDKGVATILDSRLSEKNGQSYRKQVLDSIPFKNVTHSFAEVEKFVKTTLQL